MTQEKCAVAAEDFDIVVDDGGRNNSFRILLFFMESGKYGKSDQFEGGKINSFGIFVDDLFFSAPGLSGNILRKGVMPATLFVVIVKPNGEQQGHMEIPLKFDNDPIKN